MNNPLLQWTPSSVNILSAPAIDARALVLRVGNMNARFVHPQLIGHLSSLLSTISAKLFTIQARQDLRTVSLKFAFLPASSLSYVISKGTSILYMPLPKSMCPKGKSTTGCAFDINENQVTERTCSYKVWSKMKLLGDSLKIDRNDYSY